MQVLLFPAFTRDKLAIFFATGARFYLIKESLFFERYDSGGDDRQYRSPPKEWVGGLRGE